MDQKRKLVFQLDTPYSAATWPSIASEDQDTILELLCTLLMPLGHYRSKYITPSKGKRAKKRKLQDMENAIASSPPPAPELSSYVDIGLSAVTRRLQKEAATVQSHTTKPLNEEAINVSPGRPYSVVIIARSKTLSVVNGHIPQMVAVSANYPRSQTPTMLVGLSKACEDRLAEATGIPRASCIGLYEDAPNSKPLVDFIRERVPRVGASWLEEASSAEYQETKINALKTTIGKRARIKGKSKISQVPAQQ
ncbi:hypothetical protein F5Y15DRAFT_379048 [Xylariaceae sp. FL0016]|nr:hypothetical protein F5Y15DRAFT_379048 [Xylariaceae sp. FL0016]